jgi:hypothetical protein
VRVSEGLGRVYRAAACIARPSRATPGVARRPTPPLPRPEIHRVSDFSEASPSTSRARVRPSPRDGTSPNGAESDRRRSIWARWRARGGGREALRLRQWLLYFTRVCACTGQARWRKCNAVVVVTAASPLLRPVSLCLSSNIASRRHRHTDFA